jgi:hypothetical protein
VVVHPVHADGVDPLQACRDVRYGEEVDGAVLEGRLAVREDVPLRLGARGVDGAAGEPGPAQPGEGLAADDQAAYAGGVAEHLVPADHGEVRVVVGEVEGVGRYERGGVQQDVIAVFLGCGDPVQGVPYAGEVALRRIGEQSTAASAGRERGAQPLLVDGQLLAVDGDILGPGAAGAGVLP